MSKLIRVIFAVILILGAGIGFGTHNALADPAPTCTLIPSMVGNVIDANDLNIQPLGYGIDGGLQGYLGTFEGYWDGSSDVSDASALVIWQINEQSARAIYTYGGKNGGIQFFNVDAGVIKSGSRVFVFTLNQDGTISAERHAKGIQQPATDTITFAPCTMPSS